MAVKALKNEKVKVGLAPCAPAPPRPPHPPTTTTTMARGRHIFNPPVPVTLADRCSAVVTPLV